MDRFFIDILHASVVTMSSKYLRKNENHVIKFKHFL